MFGALPQTCWGSLLHFLSKDMGPRKGEGLGRGPREGEGLGRGPREGEGLGRGPRAIKVETDVESSTRLIFTKPTLVPRTAAVKPPSRTYRLDRRR